jgi:hypothetical protein
MRRVDYLISAVREVARNSPNPDSTVSILDNTILQYLNDAQTRLSTLFLGLKNVQRPFLTEKTISIVANQEAYSVPDRMAMNKHIHQVMYSSSGQAQDYVTLPKLNIFNRDLNTTTYPWGYYVSNGRINLIPVPSSATGTLKILYDRALDQMDKRRGQITVVTGLTATTFTSITIATSPDETSTPNLTTIDYVCINDADGVVKAASIPVGSYVAGTDVLTPRAGFTFVTAGESIAVGDYVTFGKYSTTHSKLPDECESYLIHYAAEACLHQESSQDVGFENASLTRMEDNILAGFKAQTGEIHWWPQLNDSEW